MEKIVVLCDFDGTTSEIDTAEFVLCMFAREDWRAIDALFEEERLHLRSV